MRLKDEYLWSFIARDLGTMLITTLSIASPTQAAGPNVKKFSVGDRVVVAFDIGCGSCFYCNKARGRCYN